MDLSAFLFLIFFLEGFLQMKLMIMWRAWLKFTVHTKHEVVDCYKLRVDLDISGFSFSFMPLNFLKISVYVECSGVLSVIIYAYFLHEPL